MPWITAFGRCRGRSHAANDTPCEDHADMAVLAGDRVIGVLSDGMGSCRHAEVGANIVREACLRILSSRVPTTANPRQEDIANIFTDAHAALREVSPEFARRA